MVKKRRNGGKNRCGRGHVRFIRCNNCGRAVPKDKAISRLSVRPMVDLAVGRDMIDASVYTGFEIPSMYFKKCLCVSCAIHSKTVRCRSAHERRVRDPPRRHSRDKKPNTGKPDKSVKKSKRRAARAEETRPRRGPRTGGKSSGNRTGGRPGARSGARAAAKTT